MSFIETIKTIGEVFFRKMMLDFPPFVLVVSYFMYDNFIYSILLTLLIGGGFVFLTSKILDKYNRWDGET